MRLGKFDAERTITFIPPDGEFELMRYRVTDNINLPFKLLPAIQEMDKSHVSIALKASGWSQWSAGQRCSWSRC